MSRKTIDTYIDYSYRMWHNILEVMCVERRLANIIISGAGGTASEGAKTYKISLPSNWVREMGVSEKSTELELSFDGSTISVSKRLTLAAFAERKKQLGHELTMLYYYDGDLLCTTICADYSDKSLCIEDAVSDVIRTAFGNNRVPQWEDYLQFLEERCIPRGRDGLRWYLDAIGVDAYEPLEIIRKTQGRMAGDDQWLKVEVLK